MHRHLVKFHTHPDFVSLRSVSPSQKDVWRYISPITYIKSVAYEGHLDARLDRTGLREIIQKQAETGSRFWLLADTTQPEQNPIAFARTTKHSDEFGSIDEVLVDPAHVRKGLGSLIVHTALSRSFNLQQTKLVAPTNSASPSAAQFYSSIGMAEQSDPSAQLDPFGDSTATGHTTLYIGQITTVRDTIESRYSWASSFGK